MLIRIAAIASEEFMPRILKYKDAHEGIHITPYIYKNPRESSALLDQISDCDVLLFAGSTPYAFARKKAEQKKWPAVYIPFDEYTITLSLFHTMLKVPEGLNHFSIDMPNEYIENVVEELELENLSWFSKDFTGMLEEDGAKFDAEEIIRFHKELWESGQSTLALTGFDYVYSRLRELGIPCVPLMVPGKNIRDTVKQAVAYGMLKISKSSQIAVGIASINQIDGSKYPTGSLVQEATIVLQQQLLELVKETDATVQKLGMDQFVIYGTRGSIEHMIEFKRILSLLNYVEQHSRATVSIGFGFGLTAKEAESNARIALFHAGKITNESGAFLVTDEKEVIGPLNAELKTFHLKSENKEILEIAEKIGISVATVNKLVQFVKLRRDNRFTATDLAEYLGIRRRSSERILKKFIDHQVIEAVGEEQPYQKGRPRAVYRLNLFELP